MEHTNKIAASLGIKATAGMFATGVSAGFSKITKIETGHKAVTMSCRIYKTVVTLQSNAQKLFTRRCM